MFEVSCTKGEVIIQQGDVGDSFYIVESGLFQISKDGERRVTLRAGDTFGDVVLITQTTARTATAVCEEDGKLWLLDSQAYHDLTKDRGRIVLEGENWLTG